MVPRVSGSIVVTHPRIAGQTQKKRHGLEYARLTKFYGADAFPPGVSGDYRTYWLRESENLIRLEDRIRAGEVPDKELYEAMLELTGSEEAASEALYQRLKAKTRAGITTDL